MYVVRAVHLAGPFDFLVGRQRFLDEAAHLLLIVGMPLHRFDDEAMSRAPGLLRERLDSRTKFGGKRIVVVSTMGMPPSHRVCYFCSTPGMFRASNGRRSLRRTGGTHGPVGLAANVLLDDGNSACGG